MRVEFFIHEHKKKIFFSVFFFFVRGSHRTTEVFQKLLRSHFDCNVIWLLCLDKLQTCEIEYLW